MEKTPSLEWLERVNRLALVARLVSSTVHDVNNALQVIAGSVELLQMAPPATDMIARRITAIDTQTKRATRLLQDLSDFLRDARASAERIDLKATAQQAVTARHYSLTKLRTTASVEGEPVFVKANPRHLQQILLNLIVNAEEAGASTIVVRLGSEGAFGTVSVEDNADVVRLQPDSAQTSTLGIGLEVSTWLASQNGGSLIREPLAAGGSRAILRLPIAP